MGLNVSIFLFIVIFYIIKVPKQSIKKKTSCIKALHEGESDFKFFQFLYRVAQKEVLLFDLIEQKN